MELGEVLDKIVQINEKYDVDYIIDEVNERNRRIDTAYLNLCENYRGVLRRLQKEIYCIYEEYGNLNTINDIYGKDELLIKLNVKENKIFRWEKSILFVHFNTHPYQLIVQMQDKHPFTNTISYLYKSQESINKIYYNCIKSHLNGSHEDVINIIISFLPKNRFIEAKLYLLKYKYIDLADNYHCIESSRNWSPVFNSSGMHVLLRKYLEILTWVGIGFNKCI